MGNELLLSSTWLPGSVRAATFVKGCGDRRGTMTPRRDRW